MHRILLLAGLVTAYARADTVDDFIKAEMEKRHIPGVSVAVVRNGHVLKTAGYGLANLELDVPVTAQTIFQIQSITKTFVSAAILMLVEDGKLSLDDPVAKHLDKTPESWKDITLRHLLTHTSGIKDFVNEPTASLRIDATEDEVFNATVPRPLNFQPGEKYAYSNINYHLLAMIIRRHTGQAYGDFLKERIFVPLGMSDTRIMSHTAIIRNRASGYRWRDNAFRNGDFVAGSILGHAWGGILSTAADMAKWAIAFDSDTLLHKSSIEQAWSTTRLKHGDVSNYGLGWTVKRVDGHRSVSHGGGHTTGFTSSLAIYPDDKLSVVVLTNSTSPKVGAMAQSIAGIYVPAVAPRPEPAIEDRNPQVTALLRDCIVRASNRSLDATTFTANLWKLISSDQGAGLEQWLKVRGDLKSLELLSSSAPEGKRSFRYRATLSRGPIVVTLTLESDGKISEWRMIDE